MALPSITIPSRIYDVQIVQELNNIGIEGEGATMTFLREAWPEGPICTVVIEFSQDHKQTWQTWRQAAFSGGVVIRNGVEVTTSSIGGTWPGEWDTQTGNRRKLKGTDLRVTLTPVQDFRSTITVAAF